MIPPHCTTNGGGPNVGAGYGWQDLEGPGAHVWVPPQGVQCVGHLRSWWRANNGILQGYQPLVIMANVLTAVRKREIDYLRVLLYVATTDLPRALADIHSEEQHEPSAPPPLANKGGGRTR